VILLSDPVVPAVPVAEAGERLVDLRRLGELRLDRRLADPDGWYALIREGLADRLLSARKRLPGGLDLLLVEAYRPPAQQAALFEGYRDRLAALHPDWPPERAHVEASRYVSPPEVAPHGTGGAVDLTLCTAEGIELDLGTAVNDSPYDSANRCFTDAPGLTVEQRENRTVLVAALEGVGLVNYPTEWWHWSYGERYWALLSGAKAARYGPVAAQPVSQRSARGHRVEVRVP
jgi:D-alanyl-D-alanine dipeptidase